MQVVIKLVPDHPGGLQGLIDKLTLKGQIETGGMLEQGFAALKNLKL